MQAISVNQDLTDSIKLHPDNVHPFGEVVHVYNNLTGRTGYYACIKCPTQGKILWKLRNYSNSLGIKVNA